MLSSLSTTRLAALALVLAGQAFAKSSIEWQTCTDIAFNSSYPLLCGNLSVPLDYTSKNSSAKLNLQLIKIEATKKLSNTSTKSILFNFGGPGEPDRLNLAQLGKKLVNMTGGAYDLVSFDTRGTGNTLPVICYPDLATLSVQQAISPRSVRSSNAALGALWSSNTIVADTCYQALGQNGSLLGTAFVVRDMFQIADALGEDGLLRYWGFSYGTILGATAAAMFPSRVERVLLDGVLNPHEYYHGFDIEKYSDTDKVFAAFITECVAHPQACVLAQLNQTAAELTMTITRALDALRTTPLAIAGFVADEGTVTGYLVNQLYNPVLWPGLAAAIHSLLTNNATELIATISQGSGTVGNPRMFESLAGIECGEKKPRTPEFNDILGPMQRLFAKSRLNDVEAQISTLCAQWKFDAKERYEGDFHVKTRKPIMLIGNTYDPVTPLRSAHNVSSGFEGSVVLQHNGYGHASIQHPSTCTINYIQQFFATGVLPAAGTLCQPDIPPFSA